MSLLCESGGVPERTRESQKAKYLEMSRYHTIGVNDPSEFSPTVQIAEVSLN
jgi:hypothetical protein